MTTPRHAPLPLEGGDPMIRPTLVLYLALALCLWALAGCSPQLATRPGERSTELLLGAADLADRTARALIELELCQARVAAIARGEPLEAAPPAPESAPVPVLPSVDVLPPVEVTP
jgi:hypothetical protein